MLRKRNVVSAVTLGLAMAFSSANAVDAGWYVGLQAGQSTADIDQEELDFLVEDIFFAAGATVLSGSSSLEDTDTTWSVFGGYRFNPYLAVEAGYTELGTYEYRAEGLINPPGPISSAPASVGIDFSAAGFNTAVIGSLPLSEAFDLHARLGIFFSDTDIDVSASSTGVSESDRASGSDTDIYYGAGVNWHFADHWTLGLDYLLYKDVGSEDDTGETDVDSFILQASYRF